jgi:hypothetical protein
MRSPNIAPAREPQAKWARDPKEHTAKICTLAFKHINRDKSLSAHARSVGIDILDHVNWKDGYAEVSFEGTVDRLGYSYNTITKAISALVERGYFRHEPGRQGSGHCGRYWPIAKPSSREGFSGCRVDKKPSNDESENLQMVKKKPSRREGEQSYEQSKNNISTARFARRGVAQAPRPRARLTRMVEGWRPSEDAMVYAVSMIGHPDGAEYELEKFIDHWLADAGPRSAKRIGMRLGAIGRVECRSSAEGAADIRGAGALPMQPVTNLRSWNLMKPSRSSWHRLSSLT